MLTFALSEAEVTPDLDAARALYTRGREAFDAGQYALAVSLWSQAYTLMPPEYEQKKSALSKNIAIAYRRLGDTANAIRFYMRTLSDWSGRDYDGAAAILQWVNDNETATTPSTAPSSVTPPEAIDVDDGYASGMRTGVKVLLVTAAVLMPIVTVYAYTSMRARRAAAQ
jgi:tetratricopeptide (TPR) repeat protein